MENATNNQDVTIKTRIYNWIEYLCTHHNFNQVKDIPVMFTRECVTSKFGISTRQAIRHLKSLEEEGKIYRYKIYNNIYIYSIKPLDVTKDLFVRVRP
jgi:hypothetical protein